MVLTLFTQSSLLDFGAAQLAITLPAPPEDALAGLASAPTFSLATRLVPDSAASNIIIFFMFLRSFQKKLKIKC
jgi:hypothetical protein